MQSITLTPIVGLPQFDGWSQVVSSSDHSFVCVFSILGENAGNVGRDIVDILKDFYPQNPQDLHQKLVSIDEIVGNKNCDIQLCAGLFNTEKSFFGAKNASICLKRGEKVGKILSADNQIIVLEGNYKVDDVFVLFTRSADVFYEEIRQKLSQGFDVDTIITSVVPGLRSIENSSLSAIGFMNFGEVVISALEEESVFDAISEEEAEDEVAELQSGGVAEDAEVEQQVETHNYASVLDEEFEIDSINQSEIKNIKPKFNKDFYKKINFNRVKNVSGVILGIVAGLASKLRPSGDVYVQRGNNRKLIRKVLPVVLVIMVVIGLVFYQLYKRNESIDQLNQKLAPIKESLAEIEKRAEDNPIAVRDQTEQIILTLQEEKDSVADKKYLVEIVNKVLLPAQEFYESIAGKEELATLPIFYDLRLVKSDFISSRVVLDGEIAYFLDKGTAQIIQLNLKNKQAEVLPISDLSNPKDISLNGNSLFILTNEKILGFGLKDDTNRDVLTLDDTRKSSTLIVMYGSTIYLLNPDQRNVYKYTANDEGDYSDPTSWVRSAPGIDMSLIDAMVIDGDIWLADENGNIYRLRSGNKQEFEIVGLPDEFISSLSVYTTEDLENLYILDADKSRIVVLDKDGQFIKEIKSISLASGSDLIVNEDGTVAYVVSGAEIFEVGLN